MIILPFTLTFLAVVDLAPLSVRLYFHFWLAGGKLPDTLDLISIKPDWLSGQYCPSVSIDLLVAYDHCSDCVSCRSLSMTLATTSSHLFMHWFPAPMLYSCTIPSTPCFWRTYYSLICCARHKIGFLAVLASHHIVVCIWLLYTGHIYTCHHPRVTCQFAPNLFVFIPQSSSWLLCAPPFGKCFLSKHLSFAVSCAPFFDLATHISWISI